MSATKGTGVFDHQINSKTMMRYAEQLDAQLEPIVKSFSLHLATFKALHPDRVKSKAHYVRTLNHLGHAVVEHYSHGREMMDAIYGDTYPKEFNQAFINRMKLFSEYRGDCTAPEFVKEMKRLAKLYCITWPVGEILHPQVIST